MRDQYSPWLKLAEHHDAWIGEKEPSFDYGGEDGNDDPFKWFCYFAFDSFLPSNAKSVRVVASSVPPTDGRPFIYDVELDHDRGPQVGELSYTLRGNFGTRRVRYDAFFASAWCFIRRTRAAYYYLVWVVE